MRTHIKSNQPWWRIDGAELMAYRDLLYMMILRDLTAVYKQTILGPLWFVIQPLMMTVVFTVIFGRLAGVSTDGTPRFIFYMCGTVLWNFFSGCMNQSGNSLVANMNVLKKVYFPRLIVPLSAVCSNFAHFVLNLILFLGFYFYFLLFVRSTLDPRPALLLFPLLVLQCAALGLALGLWVAGLTTRYRDLRFALTFLTQLWMYATPVVWPASLVTRPGLRVLLWLNPMSFVIECARWMFTGAGTVSFPAAALSVGMTVVLLVSGLFLFNKVQRTFVDTL